MRLRALRRLGPTLRRKTAATIIGRLDAPFHAGERAAQTLGGGPPRNAAVRDRMPDQHRLFFASLPFILTAALDGAGWPCATVLSGPPGFIDSPDPNTLRVRLQPDAPDPATRCFLPGAAIGLLGIDFATKRRNRANGIVAAVAGSTLVIRVRQSFGNCPQHIQMRDIERVSEMPQAPETLDRLDRSARQAIAAADVLFVATGSRALGVDISHRGGRPGFVRIDGDTLTVPDFAGNNYFNTLGNMLLDARAALLFPDFASGDLLLVQGPTEIQWQVPDNERLAGAERLWRLKVARAWRRRGAMPLRSARSTPKTERAETGVR